MASTPLSPEELNAYNYHKRNLDLKTFKKNSDGSVTTFMGAVVNTPDGGAALIPTYWDGAVRDVPDAVRLAMKSGIRFPVYKSVDEALAREKLLHSYMDRDVRAFEKRKR